MKQGGPVVSLEDLIAKNPQYARAIVGQGLTEIEAEHELHIPNVKDSFFQDITSTVSVLKLDGITHLTTGSPLRVSKIIQQITLGLNYKGVDAKIATTMCMEKCFRKGPVI